MNRRLYFAREIFFSSLSPVWRAVEPEIVLCDLLPVKNEDVRGRARSRTTLDSMQLPTVEGP